MTKIYLSLSVQVAKSTFFMKSPVIELCWTEIENNSIAITFVVLWIEEGSLLLFGEHFDIRFEPSLIIQPSKQK